MSDIILSSKNLNFSVVENKNEKQLIFDFSFDFKREKIYTIIGPSGSGKSTLLRLFNRLNEPSSGEIYYNGKDQSQYSPCELRKKIGYLFQVPHLFETSVKDNFLYANEKISDDQIVKLLDQVRLSKDFINKPAGQLSVGEKQRVALARLLANSPDIILLDEPTSSLDPSITDKIEKLVLEVVECEKLTAIVVTHFPDQALRIGQEALLLVNGKLVEYGAVDDVINNPKSDEGLKYKRKELQ